MSELSKNVRYAGKYKGINFEIQNFKIGEKDCWTFYLYIQLDRCPEAIADRLCLKATDTYFGGTADYDYYSEPLISGIEWHCGCTYYSKERGFDGEKMVIKIGCDYQHYWDEGHIYDEHRLELDAKFAIDSFLNMVPDYKLHCGYCGKDFGKEAMSYWGDGYICDGCISTNKDAKNVGERVV